MFTLSKDGRREALDAVQRNPCSTSHVLEALAGPDPCLNITGGE
jgi:hypothetical protein